MAMGSIVTLVDDEEFPSSLDPKRPDHPEVLRILRMLEAGKKVRVSSLALPELNYKSLEGMCGRIRTLAKRRGFHVAAYERWVLKDTNYVVEKADLDEFERHELEFVVFLRRRD
jgi:hypothetical protein